MGANIVVKSKVETEQLLPLSNIARVDDVAVLFRFLEAVESVHSLLYHVPNIADLHRCIICVIKVVVVLSRLTIPRSVDQLIQLLEGAATFLAGFQGLLLQVIPPEINAHLIQFLRILPRQIGFSLEIAEAESFVTRLFVVGALEIDQL